MSDYKLIVNGTDYTASVKEIGADRARVVVNDTEYTVDLVQIGRKATPRPEVARPAAAATPTPTSSPVHRPASGTPGTLPAPLPGLVLQVRVKEGDTVQAGQCVMVMEAMKMENQVNAPHNGTVRKVFVAEGDSVGEGDPLVEITRPEMTTL